MSALAAALWLLAASPAPTAPPPPGLDAGWVAAPALAPNETAHYTRAVPNGPPQTLVATTRVCQCQPDEVFAELSSAIIAKVPDAVVDRSKTSACGTIVQHMVVRDVADGTTRANLDAFAYRTADALVTITLTFSTPSPTAADEASMRAMCPAGATPA